MTEGDPNGKPYRVPSTTPTTVPTTLPTISPANRVRTDRADAQAPLDPAAATGAARTPLNLVGVAGVSRWVGISYLRKM